MIAVRPLRFLLAVTLLACLSPVHAQHPAGLQGTLVVLNKNGHDASFIDLAGGDIIATLPTGRGPHELVITSDGRWAIATDYAGGDSLTVFDVQNLEVARSIDLQDYPRPHGILLLPGEREVIVTSEASRNLVIVNFHSGEIVRAIGTEQQGSHMVALSEDGRRAYTSNGGSDNVSVIDVGGGGFQRAVTVPDRPEAITTNRAGTEIWVGSNDEEVVTVLAAESGEVIAQWSDFEWPYRILLTDDERYAIIPDLGKQNLRFFDARSREELGRIDLAGARPEGVVLYPDDRTLFMALAGRDRVLVVDIESREILGEYPTGSAPDGIGYSPLVRGN
jgi:YVTN family beta-propeller protein